MPELRLNLVTKEWVIISTERARPPEFFKKRVSKPELPHFVDSCPFCPGNEAKTPGEIFRISDGDKWKMRVIPNKFAALNREIERLRMNQGIKRIVSGFGV